MTVIMETSSCLLMVAAVGILYCAVTAIYRLFFHPLAKFPGPKLAAVSWWYEAYFDLMKYPGGQFMFEMRRLHQEYGPVVRINPSELHIQDSTWVDKLYVGPSQGRRDKYAPAAAMLDTPEGCFGTARHDLHRQRRVAVGNFLSKTAINTSEGVVYDLAETLARRMRAHTRAELHLHFLAFSTDVLLAHCFGDEMSWGLLADQEAARAWHHTVRAFTRLAPVGKMLPWLIPLALRLPLRPLEWAAPDLARTVRLRRQMEDRARSSMRAHARLGHDNAAGKGTIFDGMLRDKTAGAERTVDRLAQQAFEFMGAGAETISRVLTAATFHLLSNADVLARLQNELGTAMPASKPPPSWRELEALPWLTAVIKESLRISAVVVSRMPVISPEQPLWYKEWTIPPGTPVSMSYPDILLDPLIFADPMVFRPERWLVSKPEMDRVSPYLVPFGRGSRICVGMHLAMAELYICLAVLFRDPDFELDDVVRERDIDVKRDWFVGEVSPGSKGVWIQYRARGR